MQFKPLAKQEDKLCELPVSPTVTATISVIIMIHVYSAYPTALGALHPQTHNYGLHMHIYHPKHARIHTKSDGGEAGYMN